MFPELTVHPLWYVLIGVVLSSIFMKVLKTFMGRARQVRVERPLQRLVVTVAPETRARIEDLQRRVGAARGESCDMAQLMQMALATFDLLEQRDQEAWRILFETECPERGTITEQLVLFNETVPDRPETDRLMTPSDAEPRVVEALVEVPELPISRTRWERLNEDEDS